MAENKNAKTMCIKYLETEGFTELTNQNVPGCDLRGFKDGKEYFFEIKSTTDKGKKDTKSGTVMLSQFRKAIEEKENYFFIICGGYGLKLENWYFKKLNLDEFLELCILQNPILNYSYNPKRKTKRKKNTIVATYGLVKSMIESLDKWKA